MRFADALGYLRTLSFESDHNAVELVVELPELMPKKPMETRKIFPKTDWLSFHMRVEALLSQINIQNNINLSISEIDSYIKQISDTIIKITKLLNTIPIANLKTNDYLELNDNLIKLISYKNKIRRKYFRNSRAPNASFLKSQVNLLNTLIKECIFMAKQDKLKLKIQNMINDRDVFKNINKLSGRKEMSWEIM